MREHRPTPARRPNPRLSNPQEMGGLPFWATLAILVSLAACAIVSIAARTSW